MDEYNQNNINPFSYNNNENNENDQNNQNNQNNQYNPNNQYNQNQGGYDYNKPEYSFWAEKVTGSTGHEYYEHIPRYEEKPEKNKKGKRFFAFLAKALVFGIVAGAAFAGIQYGYYRINPNAFKENESYILGSGNTGKSKLKIGSTELGTVSSVPESAVMKVAEETMPSIVAITSISTSTNNWFGIEIPSEGSGSGIIVGKDDNELLIATNNHVVDGTNKITVTFIDETQADAVIKGTDAKADLAVISVDLSDLSQSTLDAISIAKLGNSDDIKVGEMTIAIGNAMGYGQSVTVGYVSAKDREIEISDNYSYNKMILLQTDAAINPGNSGGALLNINGEVIGINTVKFADYSVEGMGYAIPISRAIPIINELMSREILTEEEQGFLGVGTADVTEDVSERFGIPVGVYIASIVEGGAAEKAGLREGDVITYVNDIEITSGQQLKELISSIRAGTEIEIKYMRHIDGTYKEQTTKAVLGSRKDAQN